MKEVFIDVNSIHAYGTEEEDAMQFTTDGAYEYEDGVGKIVYFESDVTGLPGTRTRVLFSPDEVIVDRDGAITSRMIFKEGVRNSFLYDTPYGQATMSINTRKISQHFNENGGHMALEYIVDVEHAVVARNRFMVDVSETKTGDYLNG